MAKYWIQKAEILVAQKKFTNDDFEIDFLVSFDDDSEPNISHVMIYNLSDTTIALLKKGENLILNAGYEGDVGTILLGTIDKQETTWEGIDKVTKLTVSEGSDKWLNAYVSKSYAPGSTSKAILTDLAGMFGMELGELRLVNDITYARGRSVSGMLQSVMRQIVKETGSKFHISQGKILIRPWEAGTQTGFVLNADTGLIESPQPFEEENNGQKTSGYRVRMLLNHRITVDSILQIQSKTANGTFRVRRGSHSGADFITEVDVVA